MPFFTRQHEEPEPEPQYEEEPRKRGLLGSFRRDPSPTPTSSTAQTNSTYRTSRSSTSTSTERPSRGHSILHKFGQRSNEELDPSIVQARERVMGAETAEREADRALEMARREVREAREEVKRLELEAKEEARRAKIKQYHAREVSKRGKALGRTLKNRLARHQQLETMTPADTIAQATISRRGFSSRGACPTAVLIHCVAFPLVF